MITLLEHVERLKKWTTDTEVEILQSVLLNKFIIDEDTLLCYFVEVSPWETTVMITWMDGDGDKLKQWINQVMKDNNCTKMYGITKRWKAIQRKFGARPVGMLMEREAF